MHYTHCCVFVFIFRSVCSIGKDIYVCSFGLVYWLKLIANVYGLDYGIIFLMIFSSFQSLLSIYHPGEGFPTQNIRNNFYEEIEPIILKFKEGKQFLNIINNGFTDKIGSSAELQKYYELQVSDSKISIPTELVEEVSTILNQLSFEQSEFKQNGTTVFKYKKRIPVKQLFALSI